MQVVLAIKLFHLLQYQRGLESIILNWIIVLLVANVPANNKAALLRSGLEKT